MGKWFRVIDPLSPLYGCDVRVAPDGLSLVKPDDFSTRSFATIQALRRVDVFVGDRPFQLVAKDGEDLGLMIERSQLETSPLQNETVETGTDRPHGLCIDESEMTRADGVTLHVVNYERATQIALRDANNQVLASDTIAGDLDLRFIWETTVLSMFERGDDQDDLIYVLRNN